MIILRLTLVFLLASFYEATYAASCRAWEQAIYECRYNNCDVWCRENAIDGLYVYSEDCLKKLSSLSCRSPADVSGLTDLSQGMSYSEARKIILNAGWQGLGKGWQNISSDGQVQDVYYNNGWHEVVDCAGTGIAPCRFEFNDVHDNLLIVITVGECVNANYEELKEGEKCDLAVNSWSFE